MLTASVSNIELYRTWRSEEELGIQWILDRIAGQVEPTAQMKAGTAFHSALELAQGDELECLDSGDYRFHIDTDCEIAATSIRELRVSEYYGDLLVRGRVDALVGNTVIDYKTTERFDADRLMSGYQWRYYLDMLGADRFVWNVFVIRETDDPLTYVVPEVHRLEQARYPALHDDCMKLARDYAQFAEVNLTVSGAV